MKIIFPTAHRYPSKNAHARHSLEMTRAFTKILKEDFLFIIGTTFDPKILEGVNYKKTKYPLLLHKLHLRTVFYFFWLLKFFFEQKNQKNLVIFVNDRRLAQVSIILRPLFKYKVIFECHGLYHTFTEKFLAKYSDGIIFTTNGILKQLSREIEIQPEKWIVLPNAVDLEHFKNTPNSKKELREKLGLPKDVVLVGYVGRFKPLGMDKGIEGMMDALKHLDENILMCFIGGTEKEIEEYQRLAKVKRVEKRCIFIGYVQHELVSHYMKAMDILALTPPRNEFFTYHTSPMKMFEYMASKRPIISSDLPALREILDEKMTLFIKPADPFELAQAINKILKEPNLGESLSQEAFNKVQNYTWEKRAQKVISFAKIL